MKKSIRGFVPASRTLQAVSGRVERARRGGLKPPALLGWFPDGCWGIVVKGRRVATTWPAGQLRAAARAYHGLLCDQSPGGVPPARPDEGPAGAR